MSMRARLILAMLLGLLLGLSLSLADRVMAEHEPAGPAPALRTAAPVALPWADARLLAEVIQRVRENYVDAVDDHKLMQNAVRGMVEALDEHSTFLSPDEFDDMKVTTSGAYAGIGIEVAPGKDGVSVVRRMANSPAERAGIQTGDVIVKIDGIAVDPADLDKAIARMRGVEPMAPLDAIKMAKHYMWFSSAKAGRELGYQSRAARLALKDAAEWFTANGYTKVPAIA